MTPTPTPTPAACPDCPHPPEEHGTFGCLSGWERAHYSLSIIQGCTCQHRYLNPNPDLNPHNTSQNAQHHTHNPATNHTPNLQPSPHGASPFPSAT
jgi:hypothetical protein